MDITLPEVVAIGIYDSRIAIKNTGVTPNRKTSMFEIELPLEENGISYVDEEKKAVTTDMLICAKPWQIRHTKLPFRCYYVHMIVSDGVLNDLLCSLPNFLMVKDRELYARIFEDLCGLFNSAVEADSIRMHGLLLELIYHLNADAETQRRSQRINCGNYKTIEQAIQYIKTNLASDLSLAQVAGHFSFSPVYFHTSFKSATGKTLHEFVEDLRIKKAANLLLTTRCSLAEIALECGFSSQAYFSYVFKRRMCITPREYVRQINTLYEN